MNPNTTKMTVAAVTTSTMNNSLLQSNRSWTMSRPTAKNANTMNTTDTMDTTDTTNTTNTTNTTHTKYISSTSAHDNNYSIPNKFNRRQSSTSSLPVTTTVLRPWKHNVVECDGDYRNESWIESHYDYNTNTNTNNDNNNTVSSSSSPSPLYQYQKVLPQLPIPINIQTTLERLVPTVIPLIRTKEEQIAFDNAVQKFDKQASVLHQRLLHRANDAYQTNTSWLQQWWNQIGYLQVRDSIVINVSYFFHFQDDPTLLSSLASPASSLVPINVKRTSCVLTALANFRKLVCTGQLPAEQIGKGSTKKPLCSTAYKYMFHATRIPYTNQDTVMIYDPSQYNHCIIVRKGIYYSMDFCNKDTGIPYNITKLQQGIQTIIEISEKHEKEEKELYGGIVRLGYCTGINRDHWANTRSTLLQYGGSEMIHALDVLQSAAFVVCLDDTEPVSRTEMAEILLHGNAGNDVDDEFDYNGNDSVNNISSNISSNKNKAQGYNRWYDKSIQIVVTNNGKCGFVGEHSMMDGMPLVNLANSITNTSYRQCVANTKEEEENTNNNTNCTIERVFSPELISRINNIPQVMDTVQKAKTEYDELVLQNSLTVQSFQGYGSDYMKKVGYSPDAYVQMAMQLASYRLFGEQVGTYESTQVRPFLHGRTETTRSVSIQSHAFVKRFGLRPLYDDDDNNNNNYSSNDRSSTSSDTGTGTTKATTVAAEKVRLFRDAVDAHVRYINLAAQGQGVDRHLFGMSMLVQNDEQVPDLYNDPVFQRSKRWRVSTSHLTHPKFDGWGYGQVVPDGVGLAYSIHPRHCIFNITALKSTGYTEQLSHLLEEALLEIRSVIEINEQQQQQLQHKPISSKL